MKRYVISPGILKEVGKEPAFVAGVMLGKTLDEFMDGEPATREVYTLSDIIIQTGLPRNPAKHSLRRLIKRQIVKRGIIDNTFRLTWNALIHLCYVRDQIVALANDGFLQTAAQYKQMLALKAQMEALQDGEADSEGGDDGSVQRRDTPEVHEGNDGAPEEEAGGTERGSDIVVASS
jgi:hypothetical protein